MAKSIDYYIDVYQAQLAIGDIQIAYEFLIKYFLSMNHSFDKR